MQGQIGFALGITALVIGVILVTIYIVGPLLSELFVRWLSRDAVDLDTMDYYAHEIDEIPFRVYNPTTGDWACCDHCYTESGSLSHSLDQFDNHTVPCNEKGCQQDTYCYDRSE